MARQACARARSCGRSRRRSSPAMVGEKLTRGPLEYAALWKVAQRLTRAAGEVRRHLRASPGRDAVERATTTTSGDDHGSRRHHERRVARRSPRRAARSSRSRSRRITSRAPTARRTDADLEFLTDAINRQIKGVEAEMWVHTCWGNPNQQPRALEGAELRARAAVSAADSTPTSSRWSAPAPTAGTCRSSSTSGPTRRSPSAWSTTATRWSSLPSTSPALIRKALE